MNYQLHPEINSKLIIRIEDESGNPDRLFIPKSKNNRHYQQYLKWLEEGNTPLPADPIPQPEPLTPQQKLEAAGLTVEDLKELLGI